MSGVNFYTIKTKKICLTLQRNEVNLFEPRIIQIKILLHFMWFHVLSNRTASANISSIICWIDYCEICEWVSGYNLCNVCDVLTQIKTQVTWDNTERIHI